MPHQKWYTYSVHFKIGRGSVRRITIRRARNPNEAKARARRYFTKPIIITTVTKED